MLAEVLHRVNIRKTAAVLMTAALLTGCVWDGQEIPEPEDTKPAADRTVTEDEDKADDSSSVPEDEDKSAEREARKLLDRWLGLMADGKGEEADELVSEQISSVDYDYRLFNTEFPGEAEVVRYAPAVVKENDSGRTVTLKVIVTPVDEPEKKVCADIDISIGENGDARIEDVTEIGSTAMVERRTLERAAQAYEVAVETFERMEPKPNDGMHHKGKGTLLTDTLENRFKPSSWEDFSVAVRDGKVMYVSWSSGEISQRYPKAPEVDGLIELRSDYEIQPKRLDNNNKEITDDSDRSSSQQD